MKPDWLNPNYLLSGTPRQRKAYAAVDKLQLLQVLCGTSPVIAGTIPLDVDIESSDIDILLHARNLSQIGSLVQHTFGGLSNFSCERKRINGEETYIARFYAEGFPIEIFAQNQPVTQQHAYLHMDVEFRLLEIGGQAARTAIRDLKKQGMKTEPAFARYFGLSGAPYHVLLRLASLDDSVLHDEIRLPDRS